MSKWTDTRDSIVDALKLDEITEETKQDAANYCLNKVIPLAEMAADKFIAKCREDAKQEHGWVYLRDVVLFPALIYGGIWLTKKILVKSGAKINTTTAVAKEDYKPVES